MKFEISLNGCVTLQKPSQTRRKQLLLLRIHQLALKKSCSKAGICSDLVFSTFDAIVKNTLKEEWALNITLNELKHSVKLVRILTVEGLTVLVRQHGLYLKIA